VTVYVVIFLHMVHKQRQGRQGYLYEKKTIRNFRRPRKLNKITQSRFRGRDFISVVPASTRSVEFTFIGNCFKND